ncbi:MAG: glucose-6-phosphate isomerase family protein [Bacteroidota bacterium]
MSEIIKPYDTEISYLNDKIQGKAVDFLTRTFDNIKDIFEDSSSLTEEDKAKIAYEVESFLPEKEGTEGGLFFGMTRLMQGKVGEEYNMTKGHFHSKIGTAEFYWGIEGQGLLLLMDGNRNVTAQKVYPGSLNYVPRSIAHRMVNIGNKVLAFGACWPSDAGHDYGTIAEQGFAAKVVEQDGEAVIIKKI